jgi:hypothetical protein
MRQRVTALEIHTIKFFPALGSADLGGFKTSLHGKTGEVLSKDWQSGYHQVGDLVLFAGLRKLVKLGMVESRGDMSDMRQSEVRLAAIKVFRLSKYVINRIITY